MVHLTQDEGAQPASVDDLFFHFLDAVLQQTEADSGTPELELRAKIDALRIETKKVPTMSMSGTNEVDIASKLEEVSAKMESLSKLVKEVENDPEAKEFLASSSDLWMPVITASVDERRGASSSSAPTAISAKTVKTDSSRA